MRGPVNRQYDVIVVGAGPAGAVAVMALAGSGRSVALLERERLPRYKTCGGGVVERALAALPCRRPTPTDIPLLPVHRIGVHRNGAAPLVVERSVAPIHMVMRADFDRFLTDRAREAGAELFEGCPLLDLDARNGRVRCRTPEAEFQGAAVIGADGAESRVAHFLPGARGRGAAKLGVALEGELAPRGVGGPQAGPGDDPPDIRFDFGAVPEGYGWVFPKNGHLSAGVFSRRARYPAFRSVYRDAGDFRGLAKATLEALQIFSTPERQVAMVTEALELLGERDRHLEGLLHARLLGELRLEVSPDAAHRSERRVQEIVEE